MFIIPICCQCGEGVNNPCKCKVIGPTLGAIAFVLSAVVCWPAGALTYCCARDCANDCFGTPAHINTALADGCPI
ncbi:g2891 [Coccomyxa elongata]